MHTISGTLSTPEKCGRCRDLPEVQRRDSRVLHDVGRKGGTDLVLECRFETGITSAFPISIFLIAHFTFALIDIDLLN